MTTDPTVAVRLAGGEAVITFPDTVKEQWRNGMGVYSKPDRNNHSHYRYWLERVVDPGKPDTAIFVMHNPSGSPPGKDGTTTSRCINHVLNWGNCGIGRLVIVNLFAYRAKELEEVEDVDDPIGPRNHAYLEHAAGRSAHYIFAWGSHGWYLEQDVKAMKLMGDRAKVLDRSTKTGMPYHPLAWHLRNRPIPAFKKLAKWK